MFSLWDVSVLIVHFLLLEPLPDPSKFIKRAGEAPRQAQQRQNADLEAEYNAVTCVAVYMLLMSFSQKGIDKLRHHQEHMSMRHPDEDYTVSKGFDEGMFIGASCVSSNLLAIFSFAVVQGTLHQV